MLSGYKASGEHDKYIYKEQDSSTTNRLTFSLRFGLNVRAKFKGIGGGLLSTLAPGARVTVDGDQYNYSDGYVGNGSTLRADSTGNFLGYTSYWGYDSASQYNLANNTFTFHNTSTANVPSELSQSGNGSPGMELTYDWQLGEKEDWHHLRYGLEFAVNYMQFSFDQNNSYGIYSTTDVYQFGGIPGQIPSIGYPGRWAGNPGDPVLVVPGNAGTPLLTHNFLVQQDFDVNLWGFRLGPYIEYPFNDKWSLHLSGGLAVGLLDANANWKEQLTRLADSSTVSASGGGTDLDVLWGFYVGLDATYQFSKHWGVDVGIQYQDLGTYSHNFGGRVAELDLSKSLFFQVGLSYSF